MLIRAYQSTDLLSLLEINQAGTPGVSSETADTLEECINLSTNFIATNAENQPIGFLTLIEAGTLTYPSANLRWFEAYIARTGKQVIYVDRIAVAASARGQQVGEQLYQAAFETLTAYDEIGCEINIQPPNPGSMRFHTRLGFQRIGDRAFGANGKSVAYYVRALSRSDASSKGLE